MKLAARWNRNSILMPPCAATSAAFCGSDCAKILDIKEFAQQLPSRFVKILDTVTKGQVEFKMRNEDTLRILDGFQKVANRVAAGVVLAALIVGAALLMQVRTTFT